MADHDHTHHPNCSHAQPSNPSVHQSLDEMEFQRSIFQAAIDDDAERVRKLARASADVNGRDNYGYTALHYAARHGSLAAAKTLIELGAGVNLTTGSLQATPLHRAVVGRKVDMVKFLLAKGADRKAKDVEGKEPGDRLVEGDKDAKAEEIRQLLLTSPPS